MARNRSGTNGRVHPKGPRAFFAVRLSASPSAPLRGRTTRCYVYRATRGSSSQTRARYLPIGVFRRLTSALVSGVSHFGQLLGVNRTAVFESRSVPLKRLLRIPRDQSLEGIDRNSRSGSGNMRPSGIQGAASPLRSKPALARGIRCAGERTPDTAPSGRKADLDWHWTAASS